jgi:hypothetical protein
MPDHGLNNIMEIDHVVRVGEDGSITDNFGMYAPETLIETDEDGQILAEHEAALVSQLDREGWSPLNGWSGQYGYSGPIMHASEYIGGDLEDYIRETPGVYVAVVVECLPHNEDGESEPAGWMILCQNEIHANYPHEPGRLYDCVACESVCHCTRGSTECVFDGEHNGLSDESEDTE